MSFIYNIGINATNNILKVVALFDKKIKLGVIGRRDTFKTLTDNLSNKDKTFWFHCASLGEYEQGLPVFKALRTAYPNHKIVLSFFSPSGFEIRKKTPIADVVIYLPIDTALNAKRFLDLIDPELTVFVKYDIWPNFLNEVKKRQLRAVLISALFRKDQAYFKFYGKNLRQALFAFDHIFTQNKTSKTLLNSIGFNNVTISGDTRFDRVFSQLEQNNALDFIKEFKQNNLCVVAGSTWPEDENLFINYINSEASKNTKFIIAAHNIKVPQIKKLKDSLKVKSVLFSEKDGLLLSDYKVFIIDTIGLLTKIYSYADIAYVGGAFGSTGLHNTLEPAVFGVPIIIGNNYENYPEASEMIKNTGMISISNQLDFNEILNNFLNDDEKRKAFGDRNLDYIKKNKGAVIQIMNFLRK